MKKAFLLISMASVFTFGAFNLSATTQSASACGSYCYRDYESCTRGPICDLILHRCLKAEGCPTPF